MINRGFNQAFLDEVLAKNDIVSVMSKYVTLTRRGQNYWACCPFHIEKIPSMSIKEDGQFFKCFGCGEAGNVINFIRKIEDVDFVRAVEILAKNAGMEMPEYEDNEEMRKKKKQRDRILSVLKATSEFYSDNLNKVEANKHVDYINKRGLSAEMVKKFKIGASIDFYGLIKHLRSLGFNDNEMIDAGVAARGESNMLYDFYGTRLIFPIINGLGEVVGFSGRDLSNDPQRAKYKNTPQTLVFNKSQLIYGYHFLRELKKQRMLDTIVLVEGQMDVIACHQVGVNTAIGVMGTALTSNHARDLRYLCNDIIVCLDGDRAGESATYKALEVLRQAGMNVKVVRLSKAKDPDEYIKQFGKDAFVEELFNAGDYMEFILIDLAKKYDINNRADKNKYINEALDYLSRLATRPEQEIYLSVIKDIVKVPIDALRNTLNGSKEEFKKVEEVQDIELKSNAYETKAKLCILASLLYGKTGKIDDYNELFLVEDEYKSIYTYILDKLSNNQDINISTIYSCFDIEKDSAWDKIINYQFPQGEVLDNYLKDCLLRLKINKLEHEGQIIKSKMSKSNNFDEKYEYLSKLKVIDEQIAKLKKEKR
ncbi:MAG: DNA primase [Clostridia bacterium]|nr:DNA primase [Clostridia bacterium]